MHLSESQQLYLRYLQGRKTAASVDDLAERFARTTSSVTHTLKPLVDAGLVTRQKHKKTSITSKACTIYHYEAVEKFEQKIKAKTQKFQYHNPFGIGVRP